MCLYVGDGRDRLPGALIYPHNNTSFAVKKKGEKDLRTIFISRLIVVLCSTCIPAEFTVHALVLSAFAHHMLIACREASALSVEIRRDQFESRTQASLMGSPLQRMSLDAPQRLFSRSWAESVA